MHAPLKKVQGGSYRWRTHLATTNLHSQRVESSLLWSGPCLESLIGSGLAQNLRVGWDNRGGAAAGVPHLARRAAGEGCWWWSPHFFVAGAPSEGG